MISKEDILQVLRGVADPELNSDVVSLNMVKDLRVEDGNVALTIQLTTPACPFRSEIEGHVRGAIEAISGIGRVAIDFSANVPRYAPSLQQSFANSPRNIIAVSSGKGGVGKTTVSVNLAVSLALEGANVGLLDADIYGPNVPMMMGVDAEPERKENRKIVPVENYGVKLMSIGFISQKKTAVIWRGPMVAKMIKQFLVSVEWGDLDYLIVDMPPGTGDAQLTLTQAVALRGGIIVTTPQEVALGDAVKGVEMFHKVKVPVLGIVQNMSYFQCPSCHDRSYIFQEKGASSVCEEYEIPLLGEIPLDPEICKGGDSGQPIVVAEPDSDLAVHFRDISRRLAASVSVLNLSNSGRPHGIKMLHTG